MQTWHDGKVFLISSFCTKLKNCAVHFITGLLFSSRSKFLEFSATALSIQGRNVKTICLVFKRPMLWYLQEKCAFENKAEVCTQLL